MGLELIIAIISFVVAAASTVYSIIQAKKMKAAALAAADARKGFEVVTEGQAEYVPIVYGRALIGGTRVYHNTSSAYIYVASNADTTFATGSRGYGAYNYGYSRWGTGYDDYVYNTGAVAARTGGYLDASAQGGKNEYMFFQQVLCAGPINSAKDVIIDGSRYIDDSGLGTYGSIEETTNAKKHDGIKAAMRLDYHYDGGEVDSIIAANFGDRNDALFTNMAYMSAVVRLDRDNPQFSGVPSVQTLIEGRKVRTINTSNVLSTTRTYKNNPAYCLLDYLLDPIHGKGLAEEEVDLQSFRLAANVCDTIVQTGATVGGKFWQPTRSTTPITTRDLPLYECNIIVDTSKPVRENIESLLSTMGDARLIWSGGQYRLSLQYPTNNGAINLAGTITDDDLVLGEDIDIAWPSAQDRYNYVVVNFHNEFENFKEDTVSWPPKYDASYLQGIGGSKYSFGVGSWDESKNGGRLLNNYGVWNDQSSTTSFSYLLRVPKGTVVTYNIDFAADNSGSIVIKDYASNTTLKTITSSNKDNVATSTLNMGSTTADKIYQIILSGSASGNENKGVAAKISTATKVLWTSRDATYSTFVTVNKTSAVYDAMVLEDSGLQLETNLFAEGVTDPYHALAKAEEICRTSRSATSYKFTYTVTDRYYEPGDFIQLQSNTMQIGATTPLYLRVDSVKVVKDNQCQVTASRFDYSQLAWAVKDDVYINVPNLYDLVIPQTNAVRYVKPTTTNIDSSGSIECDPVSFQDFAGYVFYIHQAGIDDVESSGAPIYREIGRNVLPQFTLPAVDAASAFFGVRVLNSNGRMSRMTTTDPTNAIDLDHSWTRSVTLTATDNSFETIGTTLSPSTITLTATPTGYKVPKYKWYIDGVLTSGTAATKVVNAFSDSAIKHYSVVVYETTSSFTSTADTPIFSIKQGTDLTADTVAPAIPALATTPITPLVEVDFYGYRSVTCAFDWDPVSDSDLNHYEIDMRETSTGTWAPLGTTPADVTSIATKNLKLKTAYYFRVRAVDDAGNRSAYSSIATLAAVVDNTAPAAPSNISAASAFRSNILTWTNDTATDLDRVDIYRSLTSGSPVKIGSVKVSPSTATVANYGSFIDSNLDGTLAYYYWLKSVDYVGNQSSYSTRIGPINVTSVDTTDFVQGLEPVKSVTTLPSPTGYTGPKILYNTTNGKIYRYSSGAWTTATDTGDLIGNSIDATLFASSIKPVELFTSLTAAGTDYTNGRMVYLTGAKRLYRADGTQFVDTADATQIIGQLVAGQIAAGAITTDQLAASSVVTSKLAIIDTFNLIQDAMFQDRSTDPVSGTDAFWDMGNTTCRYSGPTGSVPVAMATPSAIYSPTVLTAGSSTIVTSRSDRIAVEGGSWVRLFCKNRVGSTFNGASSIRLTWYSSDGTTQVIPSATLADGSPSSIPSGVTDSLIDTGNRHVLRTTTWDYRTTPKSGTSNYNLECKIYVPATACFVKVEFVFYANGTAALASYAAYGGIKLMRANGSEMIVDGSITADQLAVNCVTADKIFAGAISASKIAGEAITASKIKISASNLVADPTFIDSDFWLITRTDIGGYIPFQANTWQTDNTIITGYEYLGTNYAVLDASTLDTAAKNTRHSIRNGILHYPQGMTDVKPSTQYEWKAAAYNTSNQTLSVYAQFFKADGTVISSTALTWATNTAGVKSIALTTPANATQVRFGVYNAGTTTMSGVMRIGALSLREAVGGNLIVNGSITADHILANSITGDQLSLTGSLITTTAQIGDAVITGAKIKNLEVTRIKLSSDAVASSSNAANGYLELANGSIMQWGMLGGSSYSYPEGEYDINFPLTFPNACLMAMSQVLGTGSTGSDGDYWGQTNKNWTTSGFKAVMQTGWSGKYALGFSWIAIGY